MRCGSFTKDRRGPSMRVPSAALSVFLLFRVSCASSRPPKKPKHFSVEIGHANRYSERKYTFRKNKIARASHGGGLYAARQTPAACGLATTNFGLLDLDSRVRKSKSRRRFSANFVTKHRETKVQTRRDRRQKERLLDRFYRGPPGAHANPKVQKESEPRRASGALSPTSKSRIGWNCQQRTTSRRNN
jgi:hypothetical protein